MRRDETLFGKASKVSDLRGRKADAEKETQGWLKDVEGILSRFAVGLLPREQYSLLQNALNELERQGISHLSRKKAIKYIECSLEAVKHGQAVFFHHSILADVLEKARRYAVSLGDKRSAAIIDLQLGAVLLHLNHLEASKEACTRVG